MDFKIKKKYLERGFTLIEVLIVVAIIVILSAISLAAFSEARFKAENAGVKANLNGVRAQAELYYTLNSNSYSNLCTNSVIVKQINVAISNGGDTGTVATRCNSNSIAWAVNVKLKVPEGGNNYWCVDTLGSAKGEPNELAGATTCS